MSGKKVLVAIGAITGVAAVLALGAYAAATAYKFACEHYGERLDFEEDPFEDLSK